MIVFYGQGGLGNQLFQYAAARRLALQHQCELVLDPYWFTHPLPGETPRSLELDRYPVALRVADTSEQRKWQWMRGRWGRFLKPLCSMALVREQGDTLNHALLYASQNSYLHGFWQSEMYFKDIRTDLLKELTPNEPPSFEDAAVLEKINACDSVSIHVRRGDYVTSHAAASFHGVCSLDYYRDSIKYIADRVNAPSFFIFSDDPVWTRENLEIPFPKQYVHHNGAGSAFQDIRLMSSCKHHIIANSSFSWWGAWLSENSEGLVIAPEKWFAAGRSTPNLIPDRWHRL